MRTRLAETGVAKRSFKLSTDYTEFGQYGLVDLKVICLMLLLIGMQKLRAQEPKTRVRSVCTG